MEPSSLVIRFIFKTQDNTANSSFVVNYCICREKNSNPELGNQCCLDLSINGSYFCDQPLSGLPGSYLYFQFKKTNQDGNDVIFPVDYYSIAKSHVEPVEITEIDNSANPPVSSVMRFKINYFTFFGQNVYIVGSTRSLGFWDPKRAVCLSHSGSNNASLRSQTGIFTDSRYNWQGDFSFPVFPDSISYSYYVSDSSGITPEPGFPRSANIMIPNNNGVIYELNDVWRWSELSHALFSRRFFTCSTNAIFLSQSLKCYSTIPKDHIRCIFRANCSYIGRDRCLRVVGSISELGNWNEVKGIDMISSLSSVDNTDYPSISSESLRYMSIVDIPISKFPFEYKFVAYSNSGQVSMWELNENRFCSISKVDHNQISCHIVSYDSWHIHFADLTFRGASVFFSLKSENNISDFDELLQLSKWCAQTGFCSIELSGIFDQCANTQFKDQLPLSGYALDPMLLSMKSFGFSETKATMMEKLSYLKESIYPKINNITRGEVQLFIKKNIFWLLDYARLCISAQIFQTFTHPNISQNPSIDDESLFFIAYIQYLCYYQLKNVIKECKNIHIALTLRLPFAISEYSAESWYQPNLFMNDHRLGLVPSEIHPIGIVFNAKPYNMEIAESWISNRISYFGKLFPAIRLESTINFFHQWVVPQSTCVRSVFGHFEPSMYISYAELETWSLWEIDRYTKPYVNSAVIESLFGADSQLIESTFFSKGPDGNCIFKEQYKSEVDLMTIPLNNEGNKLREKHKESLLRLLGEVLLIKHSETDFTPKPALGVAAHPLGGPSFSFKALPQYEQSAFQRLHDEFIGNKQKCLWCSGARRILQRVVSITDALLLSDASGIDGDLCDSVIQSIGIVPFRVQIEGRTIQQDFDDVRAYPFFSVATPIRSSAPKLSDLWNNGQIQVQRLWEEEFWESGKAPSVFDKRVSTIIINQHCWSASMIVQFPLDVLLVEEDMISSGKQSEEIGNILLQTKRLL